MTEPETEFDLARRFESHRRHLRAVAYRMLGTASEADDAVQEAWLRLARADSAAVDNLGGWLTTVVARVCLDMLRSRRSRREEPINARAEDAALPEALADSIGPALLVVLETLAPAERLAFVLHDMFGVPFEDVAAIVDRSPAAARQLASRARRRVRGSPMPAADRERQREVVAAFLAASRAGSFDALLAVLDPDIVVRADHAAVGYGAPAEIRGAADAVKMFGTRARGARAVVVDGVPGAAWIVGGTTRVVFAFTVEDGRITELDLLGDADLIGAMELVSTD